ncbi:MAG: Phosphatidate cytidylyltransferase, partial [uncultured Rubrobacteraceae bacterium]
APLAHRHGARPGAHRARRHQDRRGRSPRPGPRRGGRRGLRTLPGIETASFRRRLRGRRHPDTALHHLRGDRHPRRRGGGPPLGALVAGGKAGDADAAGRPCRAADDAVGRGAAGAPRDLPGDARRDLPSDHDRGGRTLDLGLWRLLRRTVLRPSPRLPDPEPEEDGRGHRRRPASYGARGRTLRRHLPRLHGDQSAGDLARRLPREPGRGPFRVGAQAHPGREGPRPLPAGPRRPAGPDRQPALLGARGILHLVARM